MSYSFGNYANSITNMTYLQEYVRFYSLRRASMGFKSAALLAGI